MTAVRKSTDDDGHYVPNNAKKMETLTDVFTDVILRHSMLRVMDEYVAVLNNKVRLGCPGRISHSRIDDILHLCASAVCWDGQNVCPGVSVGYPLTTLTSQAPHERCILVAGICKISLR